LQKYRAFVLSVCRDNAEYVKKPVDLYTHPQALQQLLSQLPVIGSSRFYQCFLSEQKCHTPKCCNCNDNINGTADKGCGTTENPCNRIKFKNADQLTPPIISRIRAILSHIGFHLFPARSVKIHVRFLQDAVIVCRSAHWSIPKSAHRSGGKFIQFSTKPCGKNNRSRQEIL